jgi:hypothetical protein
MRAAEHVLLESSDAPEVPELRSARKVHARHAARSRLRRSKLDLVLFDYCYLSVSTQRWRRNATRHVLDLRFVDPTPRLARHIAWRWIMASTLLGTIGLLLALFISKSLDPWWRHAALPACFAAFGLALGAVLVSACRTTETLTLHSVHGRARLLEYTGSLGTFRGMRAFIPLLKGHLRHAVAARRRSLADHLRDEMREHSRLRALGVLADADYEVAKRRILATHAVAPRPDGPPKKSPKPTHRSPGYRAAPVV